MGIQDLFHFYLSIMRERVFLHKYSIMCATLNSTLLLLVWGFSSHSRVFYSFGEVSITSELLQIWTYTRHSWPLSSEGSLLCRTYCDMGQPFIYNGHLRGPMTLHNCTCLVPFQAMKNSAGFRVYILFFLLLLTLSLLFLDWYNG